MTSPLFLKKHKDSRTAALGGMLSKNYPTFHNEPVLRITWLSHDFRVELGPKKDRRSFSSTCHLFYPEYCISSSNANLNIKEGQTVTLLLPPFKEIEDNLHKFKVNILLLQEVEDQKKY